MREGLTEDDTFRVLRKVPFEQVFREVEELEFGNMTATDIETWFNNRGWKYFEYSKKYEEFIRD